jgi:hypothetical protein
VGIPETVAAMNTVLTVGVLTICASALVAAATMRWGLLFASLTALVVVAWAVLLQEFLDE